MTIVQRPENGRWSIFRNSNGSWVLGGYETLEDALDFVMLTMVVFGGWVLPKEDKKALDRRLGYKASA